jgi:hypothetical protein
MRIFLLCVISTAAVAALILHPEAKARDEQRGVREFHVHDESTVSRTLRFDGDGAHFLDVRAIDGSIRVIGADRADVQLDVLRVVRAETDADLETADKEVVLDIADGTPRIEAIVREQDQDVCGEPSLRRHGSWERPRYRVSHDFAIQVPRDTRLRLCTINGGELLVEGTTGDFDLSNVNGRITMPNMRGAGRAHTVNGPIVASFPEAPREASSFKTTNGDVIVGLPAGLAADLKMKTFNGGLFTDFDVQALPRPVAVAERRDGRFVYRSNQFTLVRAGGGGPELTFETFNGSVRVLRVAH